MGVKRVIFLFLILNYFPISIVGKDEEAESSSIGSMYGTLRGFMSEFGKIVMEVSSGIEKLGRGIKTMEEFLDATVDENCVFQCESGEAKRNPEYVPLPNGCGAFGFEDYVTEDMLPSSKFISCCDDHDICYGTCGIDKDECDLKFKKCLYTTCSKKKDSVNKLTYKACQAGAKLLYTGTTALGCQPYISAQRLACICSESNNARKYPKYEF